MNGYKNSKELYFVDDKLFKEIKDFVDGRLKNITSGEYEILFMAWYGSNQDDRPWRNPSWVKGYTFDLTKLQLKGFRDYQLDSFRSRQAFHPKYTNYFALPPLREIDEEKDKAILETLFQSYRESL